MFVGLRGLPWLLVAAHHVCGGVLHAAREGASYLPVEIRAIDGGGERPGGRRRQSQDQGDGRSAEGRHHDSATTRSGDRTGQTPSTAATHAHAHASGTDPTR